MIDISLIIQIFVLLNPLASVPFLIKAYDQKMNVRHVAMKAVFSAFIIAVTLVLIGPSLFRVFGITLDSFRVAGGIVLLLLALNMVRPQKEEKEHISDIDSVITIIATPTLTGPGTISFMTLKAFEVGQLNVLINIVGSFILVSIVFFFFSMAIPKISQKLVSMLSRILGLFLMAVSVELLANGLHGIIISLI